MKNTDDETNDPGDIERLLRQVGARDEPPASVMEEVRLTVHEEWLASVQSRRRYHRTVVSAIAASFALVGVLATWVLRDTATAAEVAMTVARVEGNVRLQPSSNSNPLGLGDRIAVGATIETDGAARISLAFADGISIRIDRSTTLSRLSSDRLRLESGAVYVDANPTLGEQELVIQTLAGEVQHLGTQYQIRQSDGVVAVAIREGRVEIERPAGKVLASAGEHLRISADGQLERGSLSSQDSVWDWAEVMSPAFAIDGRSLAAFLDWAGRETGRRIEYDSPATEEAAEGAKLSGSIEGLDPQTALSVVLSTTDFAADESTEDEIGIRMAAP